MKKYKPPVFKCVSCSKPIPWERYIKLYCNDYCREEAKYIRYHRICIKDKRIKRQDVMEAIRIRRAHLLSGGYSRLQRDISNELRDRVIKRDKRLCRVCKRPGKEIDHINGDSKSLHNLQLLCSKCHREKTISSLKNYDEDTPNFKILQDKARELDLRVYIKDPLLPCDDETDWKKKKTEIIDERRKCFFHSLKCMFRGKNKLSQIKTAQFLNENKIPNFSGYNKWNRESAKNLLEHLYSKDI